MSAGVIGFLFGKTAIPYGFGELKSLGQRHLMRALLIAAGIHIALIGTGWGVASLKKRPEAIPRTVRFKTIADLGAPPPLTKAQDAPQIQIPEPAGPQPSVGVPEPVPDEQVSETTTIATQSELAEMIPTTPFNQNGNSGDSLVIGDGFGDDDMPSPDDFIAVEEMPVLVSMPTPAYPDMARSAELEGVVLVRALVGKDGGVKRTQVAKSIPLLDEAAEEAVMKAVFKPAIQANKPVAVWVAIPIRFKLK
jgi:TonB family protein